MGKKLQGAALRAKKRALQAVEVLQEQQAERATSFAHKEDTELFVLDTAGDKTTAAYKKAVAKGELTKNNKPRGLSSKEQQDVERLQKLHDAETLEKLARRGRELLDRKGGRKRLHGATEANFDLWSDEKLSKVDQKVSSDQALMKQKDTVESNFLVSTPAGLAPRHVQIKVKPLSATQPSGTVVKVDVARTGQSYHPDPISHSMTVQAAVDVELKRTSAVRIRETPLAQGLTEETRRILVGDTDDSSPESEPEEDDVGRLERVGPIPKRAEKLTRAQRNKQKRLRQEQAAIERRKHEKKFLNQVSEIPRYTKELKRKHSELQERKEQTTQLKESSKKIPGKDVEQKAASHDPIRAPTYPVALTMELKSSLRSLKPKGSLVQDRVHSMLDRNLVVQRDPRAPKAKKRRLKVQGAVTGPGFEIKG